MKQETPGFIANRLQVAVMREAYSLVNRGVVSAEDLGELQLNHLSGFNFESPKMDT